MFKDLLSKSINLIKKEPVIFAFFCIYSIFVMGVQSLIINSVVDIETLLKNPLKEINLIFRYIVLPLLGVGFLGLFVRYLVIKILILIKDCGAFQFKDLALMNVGRFFGYVFVEFILAATLFTGIFCASGVVNQMFDLSGVFTAFLFILGIPLIFFSLLSKFFFMTVCIVYDEDSYAGFMRLLRVFRHNFPLYLRVFFFVVMIKFFFQFLIVIFSEIPILGESLFTILLISADMLIATVLSFVFVSEKKEQSLISVLVN